MDSFKKLHEIDKLLFKAGAMLTELPSGDKIWTRYAAELRRHGAVLQTLADEMNSLADEHAQKAKRYDEALSRASRA